MPKPTKKDVRMGNNRTPMSVMGSQGKPVSIKPMHFKNRPTKSTTFEEGTKPRKR